MKRECTGFPKTTQISLDFGYVDQDCFTVVTVLPLWDVHVNYSGHVEVSCPRLETTQKMLQHMDNQVYIWSSGS